MQKKQEALLVIGASKESIKEARLALMEILESDAEEETKRKALEVLGTLCNVSGTTLSGCNFTGSSSKS